MNNSILLKKKTTNNKAPLAFGAIETPVFYKGASGLIEQEPLPSDLCLPLQ